MLSNSWRTFRSYPWRRCTRAGVFRSDFGVYIPWRGAAQLTERLTLSLRTLFNRYTLATAVLIALGVGWMFQSTGFYARLAPSAAMLAPSAYWRRAYDGQRRDGGSLERQRRR
jgi:hypothetical protein